MVRRGGLVLSLVIESTEVIHVTKRQKFSKRQKYQIKSHSQSHGRATSPELPLTAFDLVHLT